ncbi:hypothetical protein GCM10022236_24020 [Microlunatus ginsengisoli]|uniref:Uncharacterized protein n=1 Tax=Microlunatus ginsengisoli TaxID=363863 RepID=A0ABP6ZVR1_9ACTN
MAEAGADRRLPAGDDERFVGYGAMGVPFRSGHYLALRNMQASSVGPAYRTIWHRDPAGRWTIFTTVDPQLSCPRYFGAAADAERVPAIELGWRDDWTLEVSLPGRLSWQLTLVRTAATAALSGMGGAMPEAAWNSSAILSSMSPMVRLMLHAGRIRLAGRTPNGQHFKAAPRAVWRVGGGTARLDGHDLGPLGPLREQTRLGDFWLPQSGLFFAGGARFSATAQSVGPVAAGSRRAAVRP